MKHQEGPFFFKYRPTEDSVSQKAISSSVRSGELKCTYGMCGNRIYFYSQLLCGHTVYKLISLHSIFIKFTTMAVRLSASQNIMHGYNNFKRVRGFSTSQSYHSSITIVLPMAILQFVDCYLGKVSKPLYWDCSASSYEVDLSFHLNERYSFITINSILKCQFSWHVNMHKVQIQ